MSTTGTQTTTCRATHIPLIFLVIVALATPVSMALEAGTHIPVSISSPRPYGGVGQVGESSLGWSYTISEPGATYIAIHFADFHLAEGDELIISDAKGGQVCTLTGRGKMDAGTFWAQHIKGDSAVLQLVVASNTGGPGFIIDEYVAGFVDLGAAPAVDAKNDKGVPDLGIEAICGADDKRNAVCYQSSHPTEYNRGRAVARLLINGSSLCTGWLMSANNHLLTNEHCISDAASALNTDFEFMAQAPNCADANCQLCFPGTVFSGATFIKDNAGLDYCLVQINSGNPAGTYGYLGIDNRPAVVGEQIYIPQHPGGRAKEFAILSTASQDTGGVCRVYSTNLPPCVSGQPYSDVGYFADTEGGSSGSPVLAKSSHKVVALHHCANCPNLGVPMTLVCNDMPAGMCASPAGVVLLNKTAYRCTDTASIQLIDSDLQNQGTQNVVVTTNGGDSETVTLLETPAGSAIFVGSIGVAGGAASPGNGSLQVAHGQTITVTYNDANNGSGPGVAQDTAAVDCVAPLISSIAVSGITGAAAVVTFQTNEASTGKVRYGTTCPPGILVSDAGGLTAHQIGLTGLSPNTNYYFTVEAADPAGNTASDNNGGLCYSFSTPALPSDYFTEQFVSDNDVDNWSITFTPNGSLDYYEACGQSITSLPIDPAGGSTLSLGDDAFSQVTRSVSLFGMTYGQFYVGSNGFITFTEGDGDYSESLTDHFRIPRISALFDDLNPSAGGTISWKNLADRVVVTWLNVVEYGQSTTNTFQVEMFDDGRIRISWLGIAAIDGIAGLSAGQGHPINFVESNLNGYSCPLAIVSAVSRKTHGSAGDYNVDLLAAGTCGVPVEFRVDGLTKLVVGFDAIVHLATGTPADVQVTGGTVTGIAVAGNQLTVDLSGAIGPSRVTIGFPGVLSPVNAAVTQTLCVGVLLGDATADCQTNIFDLIAIRNKLNQPVTSATFNADVIVDGEIDLLDLISTRNALNQTIVAIPCP